MAPLNLVLMVKLPGIKTNIPLRTIGSFTWRGIFHYFQLFLTRQPKI